MGALTSTPTGKVFILIVIFLLVVYYVGTTNVAATLFNGFVKIIYTLQGRNATTGAITNYPSGGGPAA